MRKYPNTVSNDNALFAANTLHNPNRYNKQNHVRYNPSTNLHVNDISSIPPPLSADSAFLRRIPMPKNQNLDPSRVGRVIFNLGAYTKRQLKDLKNRLLSELEQVRILQARIENPHFSTRLNYPPPPRAPVVQAIEPIRSNTPKGKKRGRRPKRVNSFGGSGKNPKRMAAAAQDSDMMRKCRQILAKLMKCKHGWVFNAPVDVVSLGLDDYKDIIKTPMDLGTVKSNLDRKAYKSPVEFAADVRLTFNNALKYNPVGHDVHSMAETLLRTFERLFSTVVRKMEENNSENVGVQLSKPKAREMSKEEKKVLGSRLVELPGEKMVEVFDILKKRNSSLGRDGDEIVLDIEALDENTLWELDRFVKSVAEKVEAVVGEEEVDIGEEIPGEYYPPVEIERDVNVAADNTSSNSTSGTDDTSSSSGRLLPCLFMQCGFCFVCLKLGHMFVCLWCRFRFREFI